MSPLTGRLRLRGHLKAILRAMVRVTVQFTGCGDFLSDFSEGDSVVMLSTIMFELSQDGKSAGRFTADVRLTQGSGGSREDIQVGLPRPMGDGPHDKTPFSHMAFTEAAKTYLIDNVLSHIEFRQEIEAFERHWTTSFEADPASGAPW